MQFQKQRQNIEWNFDSKLFIIIHINYVTKICTVQLRENSFKRVKTTNDFDEFYVVEAEDMTTQAAAVVNGTTKVTTTTSKGVNSIEMK